MNIVIVGAGPAGVTAAETLREYGSTDRIVMVSGEPYPPYAPPAMIEYFLHGRPLHLFRGEDFPERLGLEYLSGRQVVEVNPQQRVIAFEGGETLAYDRLLLAAGARLYAPLEGADKKGIHNFKSLQAGEELLEKVRGGEVRSALIVGAGFIGVEIALLLKALGLAVTMLVRSRVMRSMLDEETAQFVLEMLQEKQIEILQGEEADALAFTGDEWARGVLMRSGQERVADLLVAATGLKPNLDMLDRSGIDTDWGVLVDDYQRTNYADIYAAGDMAETRDRISGMRYAHANYPNAVAQGRVVGRNMLGHNFAYEGADSMNSLKHLGLPVMAAGSMDGEELRMRRDGVLRKLWLKDGRLVGFRLAGDISGAGIYLSLIRRKTEAPALRDLLADARFNYAHLVEAALVPEWH